MKNILISGLGGSLFPFLHDTLKDQYNLFYVDSNKTLSTVYANLNFFPAPLVDAPEYFSFIRGIIDQEKIDIYIPLIDEEIVGAIKTFSAKGNKPIVLSPDIEFCKLCLDKFKLMKALSLAEISTIDTYLPHYLPKEFKYPVFIKPRQGRGSRDIRVIHSQDQLKAFLILNDHYSDQDMMVQEYIQGQEYTVGVLTNNKNDLITICSKKVLQKKGITLSAVTENNPTINRTVEQIVDKFQPKGPFNVQLFLTKDDQVKIIEINPRFSTTSILSGRAGINKIKLYIDHFDIPFEHDPLLPREGVYLYRRWESLFYE